jgi:predicted Rossmann fold flavoprotein
MCAITAGQRGKRVIVLERNSLPGRKILISGGGRCNFTNVHCAPDNFISGNPHFAKSALARFTPSDFVALVEKHRIPYHEKKLGQLFCDGSAKEIVDMLLAECLAAGVRVDCGIEIEAVQRSLVGFSIRTKTGELQGPALVIATGGLSIPKIGATDFGYKIARQFRLKIRACRPALVPLVLGADDRADYCDLAGVSTDVIASVDGQSFREKMLITHSGLSGPAILQISSYWKPGEIGIDLMPGTEAIPRRLLNRWRERNAYPKEPEALHDWRIRPAGTEGYGKAEVTAGGVDTDELSSKTMETLRVPGLYFIGEVVDVTGQLGGFNFQWAWASGFAAGTSV